MLLLLPFKTILDYLGIDLATYLGIVKLRSIQTKSLNRLARTACLCTYMFRGSVCIESLGISAGIQFLVSIMNND